MTTDTINWHSVRLSQGHHPCLNAGACVMELASYIAREPWSDYPVCVSPVLGAFLRAWNDALDDETRQRLLPYAEQVIGTADDGKDDARAWMATDWLVRVCAPAFLELAGLMADAASWRTLPPLTDRTSAQSAMPTLSQGRFRAAAARDAAWAAAWAAAGVAAWAAAWAATQAAARADTRDAARDAAWAAAWAAAGDAAWAAAGAAAGAAAWAALQPTVQTVQESAFNLLDRMIGKDRHVSRDDADQQT